MDCPHCTSRNPPGEANCSNCRAPLGGAAATLVGELTPPVMSDGITLDGVAPTPLGSPSDVTLDGSPDSSMAIPTAWSVPAYRPGVEDGARVLPAAIQAGLT